MEYRRPIKTSLGITIPVINVNRNYNNSIWVGVLMTQILQE